MILLLTHPLPLLPSVSSTGETGKTEKERQLADGRGGRGCMRSRIIRPQESLGPSSIIQYSLSRGTLLQKMILADTVNSTEALAFKKLGNQMSTSPLTLFVRVCSFCRVSKNQQYGRYIFILIEDSNSE
jgi:hypothetical protein